MKKIKLVVVVLLAIGSLVACKNDKFGFLSIDENAGYTADSLLVYVSPPSSSAQYRYGTPYFTSSIEGVQGTFPLTYALHSITGDNADGVEKLKAVIDVKYGIGKIAIPGKNHNIPVGRYMVSVQVTNVYGTAVIKDIVRIVVK